MTARGLQWRAVLSGDIDNNGDVNGDNNINNPARLLRMVQAPKAPLYVRLCSYENLLLAFQKARKRKTLKPYVKEFEANLKENLLDLRAELIWHTYRPRPLRTFVLRDPKTRKISKSHFRDRVVHHALCNVIEPIFEKRFFYDSYANRRGKGVLKALARFEGFQRRATRNFSRHCFVLKADIKHYFDTVDHTILLGLLARQVKDDRVLWLAGIILSNFSSIGDGKGMPLGNLTSQFFANVYLHELDHVVKQELGAKYYVRYVDDFVILGDSFDVLVHYKERIDTFLRDYLSLSLHPLKTKILHAQRGIGFLGVRIFPKFRLLKHANLRKFHHKLAKVIGEYKSGAVGYDQVYDFLEGWIAYARCANTYNLRARVVRDVGHRFPGAVSSKEIGRMLRALRPLRRKNLITRDEPRTTTLLVAQPKTAITF